MICVLNRDYDIHGPAGPTAFWKESDDLEEMNTSTSFSWIWHVRQSVEFCSLLFVIYLHMLTNLDRVMFELGSIAVMLPAWNACFGYKLS